MLDVPDKAFCLAPKTSCVLEWRKSELLGTPLEGKRFWEAFPKLREATKVSEATNKTS
jgi:hypothetical protein